MRNTLEDGVHGMVTRERMCAAGRRLRDGYAITPGARLVRREFGCFCLERWLEEELPPNADFNEFFDYDPLGNHMPGQLSWCKAAFVPPFEVRILEERGDDVLLVARKYPDLVIIGGMDKRALAEGKGAIDRLVERIIPPMRARGGHIPTCDHGVPEEVSLENYMHYRRRCVELGG